MKRQFTAESIEEAFARVAQPRMSGRPWIAGTVTTTYGDLVERVRQLTAVFHGWGLAPGSRVMLCTANDHELAVHYVALLCNGIAAVLLDPQTRASRFAMLARIAGPDGYIVDAGKRDEYGFEEGDRVLFISESPRVRTGSLFSKLFKKRHPETGGGVALAAMNPPGSIDPSLTAHVLFTSGTTSRPKGVQISHRALFAHLNTLSAQYDYSDRSNILNLLKLHHTDGITQGPMVAFANGCTVHRPFDFDIQHLRPLLDVVYRERITHFVVVPTILALIQRLGENDRDAFKTPDFRMIISAADLLDPDLWRSFEERYSVVVANMYGLTETVTGGLFCGPTARDRKVGTVGKPVDCEVRIVDGDGHDVADGATGELLMKGDLLMDGYLNAPEDTAAVLENGWFRTGDFFMKDPEGFYHFKGRKKLLIITGGINVHPEEVSEVIRTHADVADALTFGEPDPVFGEITVSCVVLRPGVNLAALAIIDYCREHLEGEKVPARVHFLSSLPRTAAGKPSIPETRAMIAAIRGAENHVDAGDVTLTVLKIAAASFGCAVTSLTQAMKSGEVTGWDSLAHLEFITALEQKFGIVFTTSEIMQIDALSTAIELVEVKTRS